MTDTITEAAKLAAECRARADKATPGPWEHGVQFDTYGKACWNHQGSDGYKGECYRCNAAFVIAARSDVPALCDAIDKQAEEIKRLRAIEERAKAAVEELSGSKYLPSPQTYVARVRHILVGHGYE